jgi:hypothetical protein
VQQWRKLSPVLNKPPCYRRYVVRSVLYVYSLMPSSDLARFGIRVQHSKHSNSHSRTPRSPCSAHCDRTMPHRSCARPRTFRTLLFYSWPRRRWPHCCSGFCRLILLFCGIKYSGGRRLVARHLRHLWHLRTREWKAALSGAA